MAQPKHSAPGPDGSAPKPVVPIVAIGASAGGIEAVLELLKHLSPTTGFAFVYIQHVDPTHESQLASILGRATTMPALEAEHVMRVEPNHLYLIPPDRDMEVVDGVLTLMPRKGREAMHMPIDRFFMSLADRQKEGAIGIVLSGMASDGTLGLRAIKAAGGITFAQDDSARFQSMPRSAIAEKVVDRVLAPQQIAREINELSRQPKLFLDELPGEPDQAANEEQLKLIFQLLRRAVGVDFTHYKRTTIWRRIVRRMLLYRLESLADYAQYLKQHPDEMAQLYGDLLINVTTFFRDEETMDYLRKVLLPRLIREKAPHQPLRIWVPACSTGQEAYSLAMLLLDGMGNQPVPTGIQIFATDLSEAAVAKARLGSYTRGEVADVPARLLQRFFTKVDDHYRINKNIRDLCVFAPHNLLRDPPFSRLDLISCRNLLIYLDSVLQRKAITTFHYALNPSGYLLLGKSEGVNSKDALFTQVEKNYKVFARKNDVPSRVSFDLTSRSAADGSFESDRPDGGRVVVAGPKMPPVTNNLEKTVDELLLRQYVPASVVVNQELDILQFRGSTGLFLEPAPGRASLNLLKMARPALAFEIRSAVLKARKSGQPVRKTGLELKLHNKTHYVAVEVAPLGSDTEEQLFLVLFEEVTPLVMAGASATDASNRRIKQLEEELATLREDMRSVIEEQEASNEELQSANEEIISSNEELQSINEELETSKEEIESTNEELLTINQELQVRNDQLSESIEFSNAIFATIREATLVLDEDLRVKSANKTFYDLFKVTEEETEGRLIYELGNRQWDIPQLRVLLTDAITHNVRVDGFEVTHTFDYIGEKVLLLNARRVIRQQESILLAIEDITSHRQAQRLLAEREAWMHNLVDSAPVLIWVADAAGQYTFFNEAWLTYTGGQPNQLAGSDWEQDIHPDDCESYLSIYRSASARREPFQAEFRLKRHDGEYHWILVNAKPTFSLDGTFNGYIGTGAEIYNRKTLLQALDLRARQRIQQVVDAQVRVGQAQRELALLDGQLTTSPAATYEYLPETGQFLVSDEMFRLFGYEPGAFEPTPDFLNSRTHPDDVLAIRQLLTKARTDHRPFSYVRRIYTPSGKLRYLQTRHEVVVDPGTKAVTIVGTSTDSTARKLAQEKLQQASDHLRSLIENTPDVITRWDTDLKLVYANAAFESKTGLPNAQVLGLTNLEMGQPVEIAVPYMDKLQMVIQTGQPQSHYNSFPTPKGLAYFYSSLMPEFNASGTICGVLAIARDITDLKLVEEIQETANNLQGVLNASPACIGLLKAVRNEQFQVVDFRVVVCNQRFADLTGEAMEQLPGLSVTRFTDALWEEGTFDTLLAVLKSGEPAYHERMNQINGRERWIGMSIVRHDGGVVLSGLDVTDLKLAELRQGQLIEEIKHSQGSLQALQAIREQVRERGEFLRATTHDLRGSFGVISGAASLLNLSEDDNQRAEMLAMLQRNVRQTTQMLTQLLDFSRLEAGQETVELTSLDAADLLRELVDRMQPVAAEKKLYLRTDGPAQLRAEGDALKVQRIVQNLVLNALKYTRSGGITVRWQPTETGWQFSVEDTGPGLSPEQVQRLTGESAQPSVQAPLPNATGSAGEGIGLIIVKRLVTLLGGRMSVESEAGRGTRFQIAFSQN